MSDDLKTNYTKLNKRYQELKKLIAEKEEFLHNRDKWIAELEKQVNLSRAMERVALKSCKELEEKLEEVKGQYAYECECNKQFVECQNENKKLKQQLAEKDAEIRVVYSFRKQKCDNLQKALAEKEKKLSEYVKIVDDLYKQLSDKCDFCDKTHNQDKISFAIAELEKVKELLNTDFESIISWIDPYEYGECLNSMTYNHKNTIEIIDNQINELKRFLEI